MLLQDGAIVFGGILRSTVGMMHATPWWIAGADGGLRHISHMALPTTCPQLAKADVGASGHTLFRECLCNAGEGLSLRQDANRRSAGSALKDRNLTALANRREGHKLEAVSAAFNTRWNCHDRYPALR
jgi:hypothetical protein